MVNKSAYTVLLLTILELITVAPSYGAGEELTDISATLRMVWGLLVVLGILFIIYAVAKKKLNFLQSPGQGIIKVLEVRHLMPKKSLYLIEVRGKEYLIGSGSDRLELIADLGESSPDSFTDILDQTQKELSK